MQKAQGALEYLLLIGGAVLVAVIVITLLLGLAEQGQTDTQATVNSGLSLIEQKRADIISGTVSGTGGTQTTVDATLTGSLYATSGSCNTNTTFLTATDLPIFGIMDFGGVLRFTVPIAIPAGATINTATLGLYEYIQIGAENCTASDPLHIYKNSSFICEQNYNLVNDTGAPSGADVIIAPAPNTCAVGYKTFEINNAIPTGTDIIILEIRGSDTDGAFAARGWHGFDNTNPLNNPPTLKITYTA